MRRLVGILAFSILSGAALSGCTYNHYYPMPIATQAPGTPAPGMPAPGMECREFTQTVTVDGKPAQASGQVCKQPDGSWRLM